jgi:hypothetical protein
MQDVADHEARERRERPDRQAAKTVEQALAEIGGKPHARIDGIEDDRLHEDAGQEHL